MDKKQLTLRNLIRGVIWFLAIVMILLIWPFGIIQSDSTSRSVAEEERSTKSITWDIPIIQEFVPQQDFLKSMEIKVDRNHGESVEGRFYFKVFDQDLELLKTYELNIVDLEDKNFTEMPLNIKVKSGQTHYFRIEVKHEGQIPPKLCYRTLSGAGPIENKTFYYGSEVLQDASPSIRYNYKVDLTIDQILVFDSFIIFMALFLLAHLEKKLGTKLNQTISKEKQNRAILTVLGILFLLGCGYYLLVRKIFGGTMWDMGIYFFAIFCGIFLWVYGVWNVPAKNPFQNSKLWIVVSNTIQTFCFAVICVASTYYFNSGSNYGHKIGTRYILIAFGIVLMCYLTKKRVLSKISLGYYGISVIALLVYIWMVQPNREELHLFLLNGITTFVWGLLLLWTLLKLGKKELPKLSISFTITVVVFFILLIVFRNTRTWPFTLVIPFSVLYLQKLDKEQTNRLLQNFCNGLLWSFGYLMLNSVLFRPYYSHNYARYPGFFFSVASAALYELAIFCTALTKVIVKMQEWKEKGEKKIFCYAWKELVVFGIVVSYLMLSLSRTALLAVAIIAFFVFLVTEWIVFRDRWNGMVVRVGLFFWAVFLTFPVTYTVTRCLPALVNRPYIMEPERFKGTIEAGEKIDSYRYMDFRRYLDLSADKIMNYVDEIFHLEEQEVWNQAIESQDIKSLDFISIEEMDVMKSGEILVSKDSIITKDELYVKDSKLVASTTIRVEEGSKLLANNGSMEEEDASEEEVGEGISNGRLEIFTSYGKQLNWKGHDSMVLFEDGEARFYHAHNSFIQTAYDNGILTAIVFMVLGVFGLVRSIFIYKDYAKEMPYSIVSMIVIIGFGVASLTEWVFHPCIVLGFACFFVLKPLLFPLKGENQSL